MQTLCSPVAIFILNFYYSQTGTQASILDRVLVKSANIFERGPRQPSGDVAHTAPAPSTATTAARHASSTSTSPPPSVRLHNGGSTSAVSSALRALGAVRGPIFGVGGGSPHRP
eukprot:scaffold8561_cov106-Isochrysis_galbana.AAC.1